MKKTLILLISMFLLLPVTNVFATIADGKRTKISPYTNGILIPYEFNKGDVISVSWSSSIEYGGGAAILRKELTEDPYLLHNFGAPGKKNIPVTKTYVFGESYSKDTLYISSLNTSDQNVYLYEISLNDELIFNGQEFFNDIEYFPVTELKEKHNHNSVTLSWNNPTSDYLIGILIKRNGVEVAELDGTVTEHSIEGLLSETTYKFEVLAKYSDGLLSNPQSITVKTDLEPLPDPVVEVINLKADAEYNRVDLSWTLPEIENLHHVNIYRDTVQQGFNVFSIPGSKIFETNGTYFNDLTVSPETKYEYTLTTETTEGIESDGVFVVVTTLAVPVPPDPEIIGGGFEKDPISGDFIYYWEEPSEGQVKIIVGGNPYKTVSAASKRIIIPKNEMKYTAFGEPDVSLIAVDQEGNESPPVKPPLNGEGGGSVIENVKTPFSPGDLLATGTSLLWIVGPFVLLSLAFLLVPKLRGMLFNALGKNKVSTESARRFRSLAEPIDREPRERVVRERTLKEPREQRIKAERTERTMRAPRERVRERRMTRAERS